MRLIASIFTVVTATLSLGLSTSTLADEPFMSEKQYENYSVRYQCILNRFHDDLEKKNRP